MRNERVPAECPDNLKNSGDSGGGQLSGRGGSVLRYKKIQKNQGLTYFVADSVEPTAKTRDVPQSSAGNRVNVQIVPEE